MLGSEVQRLFTLRAEDTSHAVHIILSAVRAI